MKWALLAVVVGYILLLISPGINSYILPVIIVGVFFFLLRIYWKRFDRLPSLSAKLNALGIILVASLIFLYLSYYVIQEELVDPIWYPPAVGVVVLLRKPLKFLIGIGLREPQSYGVASQTEQGEMVRSKAEKQVADWLFQHNLDYEYEKILQFSDGTLMTDFYLPRYDIYMEYWGMAAADGDAGEQYRQRKKEKLALYERHNIKLISIYPHHLYELDAYIPHEIDKFEGRTLWQRFMGFVSREDHERGPDDSEIVMDGDGTGIYCDNCGEEGIADTFCTGCGTKLD